jgi:hypothetical protein
MSSRIYLMLRSARRAHLEARTAALQRSFGRTSQFPDNHFRGGDGYRIANIFEALNRTATHVQLALKSFLTDWKHWRNYGS